QKYAQEQTITLFVVGYPLNMDGNPSQIAGHVDAFLKQLAKKFPDIPIQKEDERFTSVLAHRAMIEGGMKKKDRMDKSSVDKISAAILLQSFLDRNQGK
ncbi:MAG: Holliday junction resolvase RuvX, partial [Bacteroidales bacterium]|nr:Holliday junction resolvase RuvX [Bacteroidales bacterium]